MSNQRNLARLALRSTVWLTIGNYLNQIIGFLAILLLTRLLEPAAFGTMALATFWSGLLNLRVKLGLVYSAVQYPNTGELLGSYFVIDIMAALLSIVLAGLMGTIFVLNGQYSQEVVVIFVLLIIIDGLAAFGGAQGIALEKELQLGQLALVSLISNFIAYPVAVLLALSGAGLWSIVSITVIIAITSLVGTLIIFAKRLRHLQATPWRFNKTVALGLIRQGVVTGTAVALLTVIGAQYDNFLIGTFVGEETLGFYDRAYRMAQWPNVILLLVITKVGFLTFAKVKNDLPRLTQTLQLSLWVLFILGLPINITLFFSASDLVNLLYGPTWAESATYLRVFSISNWLWTIINLSFWLAVAIGDWRTTLRLSLRHALLMVAIASPLAWLFGTFGTIAGVFTAMIISFALSSRYLFQQVPIDISRLFWPPVVITTTTALLLGVLTQMVYWLSLAPMLKIALTSALAFGLFAIGYLILRREETLTRLRYLTQVWGSSTP